MGDTSRAVELVQQRNDSEALWLPQHAIPLLPSLLELSNYLSIAVEELDGIHAQVPEDEFRMEIERSSLSRELSDLSNATFRLDTLLRFPELLAKYPNPRTLARSRRYQRNESSSLFATRTQDGMFSYPLTPDETGRPIREVEWELNKLVSRIVCSFGLPEEPPKHEQPNGEWPNTVREVAKNFTSLKTCVAALDRGVKQAVIQYEPDLIDHDHLLTAIAYWLNQLSDHWRTFDESKLDPPFSERGRALGILFGGGYVQEEFGVRVVDKNDPEAIDRTLIVRFKATGGGFHNPANLQETARKCWKTEFAEFSAEHGGYWVSSGRPTVLHTKGILLLEPPLKLKLTEKGEQAAEQCERESSSAALICYEPTAKLRLTVVSEQRIAERLSGQPPDEPRPAVELQERSGADPAKRECANFPEFFERQKVQPAVAELVLRLIQEIENPTGLSQTDLAKQVAIETHRKATSIIAEARKAHWKKFWNADGAWDKSRDEYERRRANSTSSREPTDE